MNESVSSEKKILELESIRGLAAFLVIFHHIPYWNPLFDIRLFRNGSLMVELFFVLSGFVIYTAYAKGITEKSDLLRFQFLRFGRLYPVHLLFLFIFALIEIAKYVAEKKYGVISPNTKALENSNFTAFFQHLFLVQAIGPMGNFASFNGPSWSISVEFYTYLIFGVLTLLSGRFKDSAYLILFLASFIFLSSNNTFGFGQLFRCLTGFFLGCVVANIQRKYSRQVHPAFSLACIILTLIFLCMNVEKNYNFAIYFLTAILIFFTINSDGGLVKIILRKRALTWLGAISYSLYMCHFAIIWIVSQAVRIFLKKPEVIISGKSCPQLSFFEASIAYAIIIASVLLTAHLTYKYVEVPCRKKSRAVAKTIWG